MARLFRRTAVVVRGVLEPLDEARALRALRIPHIHQIDDISERGVREAVRKAMGRALDLRAWQAVFAPVPVEEGKALSPGSEALGKLLSPCREASLVVVTLGEAWDSALDELVRLGEPAEAWFLDALGTRMADGAARVVEARIAADMAREGLCWAGRLRPGYGDFGLEAQAGICARLRAERIFVHVNEAYALLPRKSVSGVLGWKEGQGALSGEVPRDEED